MGILEDLLQHGADPNRLNGAHDTALHMLIYPEGDFSQSSQFKAGNDMACKIMNMCANVNLDVLNGDKECVLHTCIRVGNSREWRFSLQGAA